MLVKENELGQSLNPYLLQHKTNPVAWHAWGEKAFEEAKQRNVPLLVSIGYSTCHWCHVMAHEVFEDEEAASIMNDALVCIKVDREEHPEVDEVYMEACQAMNGSGGWPLNVFVGHDRKPFFAATYVPREKWKNLVVQIADAWKQNRDQIDNFSAQLTEALQDSTTTNREALKDVKEQIFSHLTQNYDSVHPDFSGEGRAPRFPSHTLHHFLLAQRHVPDSIAIMLESVLEAIQDSGLHDRVGGGFHRYSTDREWRVPHFEKMLYDNAQLMSVFALASSRYERPDFLQTAERIATYLNRDMAVYEHGQFVGFGTAEDADDPLGEGSFYAWVPEELQTLLGAETGKALANEWNITDSDDNIHGVYPSRIPHPRGSKAFQQLPAQDRMVHRLGWNAVYNQLLEHRKHRPRPFRDDKVLTETNALALIGFSMLYAHTSNDSHKNTMINLAQLLTARFNQGYLERLPGKSGHITDYGHTALGMFSVWEVTFDHQYLELAMNIVKSAFEKFCAPNAIIYSSSKEASSFMRFEEKYDHAQPAGAHSLLLTWVRLHSIGKMNEYEGVVNKIIGRRQGLVSHAPVIAPSFAQAMCELEDGPTTLTVPTNGTDVSVHKWAGTEVRLIPDSQVETYQLCERDRCLLPVSSPHELSIKYSWV